MDTRRVAVSSIDVAADLGHCVKISVALHGWTVFATQVEAHENRVPTLLRLYCCSRPRIKPMEGMVALSGFAAHDYVEPGATTMKTIHGVAVVSTASRTAEWRKALRSIYSCGFRGWGRRSIPFLPSRPVGNWWIFWAPVGTGYPAGLNFVGS